MNNRQITRKNLCLTFPRCPVSTQQMLDHLEITLGPENIKYVLIAQEHHQDEGLHLHCFVQLHRAKHVRNMTVFDLKISEEETYHPHLEEAQNVRYWITYCKKENNWIEKGINPLKETKKTKKEINEMLIATPIQELVDNGEISLKDVPRIVAAKEQYKRLLPKAKWRNVEVKWYYGSTGTNKTRKAVAEAPNDDFWISNENLKWFDDYNGQSYVIFDDLRANSCDWGYLLRLLDGYPLNVQIKGGMANWIPTTIVITAPTRPEEMFVNHKSGETWDKIDQLLRRISTIRNFDTEPYEVSEEVAEELIEAAPSPIPMADDEFIDFMKATNGNSAEDEIEVEIRLAREARDEEERHKELRRKLPELFCDDETTLREVGPTGTVVLPKED